MKEREPYDSIHEENEEEFEEEDLVWIPELGR